MNVWLQLQPAASPSTYDLGVSLAPGSSFTGGNSYYLALHDTQVVNLITDIEAQLLTQGVTLRGLPFMNDAATTTYRRTPFRLSRTSSTFR